LITRAGLIVTGTASYVYSVPIWFLGGPYASAVVLSFGVATYLRAYQITQQLEGKA
jgi:hypothetical protein